MSGTNLILLLTILISLLGLSSVRFTGAMLLRPFRIAHGQGYETLIMSGFVHADLGHLIFNLITLWSFGPPLEREIGMVPFLLLYMSGLLVSSLGTTYKHRDEPEYASLGASGAILAVLFASIAYFPAQRVIFLFLPVPIPGPLFAILYLGYSYYSSRRAAAARALPQTGPFHDLPPGSQPVGAAPGMLPQAPPPPPRDRINHDAHIFGALTGLAYVLVEDPERFQGLVNYFTGRG